MAKHNDVTLSIAHIMLEPKVFNWLQGVSVWQAPLQLHHCIAHVT